MQHDNPLELSVIVPVLNEAAELPALFETLSAQQSVRFELILCDGGSGDGTPELAANLAPKLPFPLRGTITPRGRGRQMNAGAALAAGEWLLFLHADSRFPDRTALYRATSTFREQLTRSPRQVAGRFALRFRRSDTSPSLAYFFYEAKARLNRADCIRGDQGFLISGKFFHQSGGFDTSLPFYEDVRLVSSAEKKGAWVLLPAEITTSARRFEAEGLCRRQVVNAIIVNAAVTGWAEFFTALPGLYRCHDETGRLRLFPLLEGIRSLIAGHDRAWRRTFWRETGRHVASNTWQLFFWLDVRRDFRAGQGPGEVKPRWLGIFERRLAWLFRSLPAAVVTAGVVRVWFRLARFRCGRSGH